jgi:Flp pilus assembly protein TadB
MSRSSVISLIALWAGATLLLSLFRPFTRSSLFDRLRPFVAPQAARSRNATGLVSVESFAEVIGPLAGWIGSNLNRVLGISDDLELRLRRIGSPFDVSAFRVRQVTVGGIAALAGLGLGLALGLETSAGTIAPLGLALAAGVLAFLVLEQQVVAASNRRRRRLFEELPVVTEQVGMLLGAGYSLGASLNRVASRSSGVCAQDLRAVANRIRQGLSDIDALREWADLADVPELSRLVGVLALNRQAGDLGRLISEEARSMRREAHRQTLEAIERRGQMVWIPVTVATLLPGVLLMSIPFVSALRAWSAL